MSDHVYRVSEIVGTSPDSIDTAIRNAISRATKTLRHVDWFEVVSVRGEVEEGGVAHFQVTLKVGFRLEDEARGSPTAPLRDVYGRCAGLTPTGQ